MKDNDRTPSEELEGSRGTGEGLLTDPEPHVGSMMSEDEKMRENEAQHGAGNAVARQPYRMHLPVFIREEDIGLGDVVKRVTSRFGIRPCGGCERRAAVLNRWFVFSGQRSM